LHNLDFGEPALSILEEDGFVRGKAIERIASACRPAPCPRIYRAFPRRG
jgi:hypothetical protein